MANLDIPQWVDSEDIFEPIPDEDDEDEIDDYDDPDEDTFDL